MKAIPAVAESAPRKEAFSAQAYRGTAVEHLMFGSTAEKVLRGAHCAVLTVKPPDTNP